MRITLPGVLPRHLPYTARAVLLHLLLGALLLTGCGKSPEVTPSLPPVVLDAGDECHVCGMLIGKFPGPKGEAYQRGATVPFKFCSTRDLFTYLLQPENAANVTQSYVQDMGATDWEHPSADAFVDARTAWYVADQPLKGSMGPTLASFKNREDAQAFIDKYGGRLLRFEDITLELLANMGQAPSPPARQ